MSVSVSATFICHSPETRKVETERERESGIPFSFFARQESGLVPQSDTNVFGTLAPPIMLANHYDRICVTRHTFSYATTPRHHNSPLDLLLDGCGESDQLIMNGSAALSSFVPPH